ncbi:MAG: hypothetical protein Q9168_004734 [Polycauliona sp. 1 TL-2023]
MGRSDISTIVDQACRLLGVKLPRSAKTDFEQESGRRSTRHTNSKLKASRARRKHGISTTIDLVEVEMSQKEIDAQATSAIRELFPRIPDEDVQQIITRAFTKGTAKVGTATDQPFIRRVHLAVGAHIRHMYTDYDSLLKVDKHNWLTARAMVQPITLDKIIEWRDEKDEPDAVEDILREVIVIPDDEEDESEDERDSARQNSVEVVSSRECADNVQVQPFDDGASDEETRRNRLMSPEDDWAPGVRFIRRISTPPAERRRHQDRVDRQHAHRTRVWQEAVSRRKNTAHTGHGFATPSMYQPHSQRLAPPNSAYSQPAFMDPSEYESRAVRTDSRSLYANADVEQPAVGPYDALRAMDRDRNRQYWPSGQNMKDVKASLSNNTHAHSPDNRTYLAHERLGDGQNPSRFSNDLRDRPAVSPFVLPESERLVPSVENESHALRGQEPLHHVASGPSDRQLHDGLFGPRILELDDPDTPTLKRRRIEDIDWATRITRNVTDVHNQESAPLAYRNPPYDGPSTTNPTSSGASRSQVPGYDQRYPRRIQLVPINRSPRPDEGDGPTSAIFQHGREDEIRVPQPLRDPRSRHEPHVDSPLRQGRSQPQQELFAGPASRAIFPNHQLSPEVHKREQPMSYPLHGPPVSYGSQSVPRPDNRQVGAGKPVRLGNMPVRLRPVHHNGSGSTMHAGDEASQNHSDWVQHGTRALDPGAPYYTQTPAHCSQENVHRVGRNPQQTIPSSPGGYPGGGRRFYDEARPGNNPPKQEATNARPSGPEREAIYISSSPLGGAR